MKQATSLALLLLALCATVASGAGINLSLDDCGQFGGVNAAANCSTNTGVAMTLVGSVVPPASVDRMVGMESYIDVRTEAGTPSPWWTLDGCRSSALTFNFEFVTGPSSCNDFWAGQASGGGGISPWHAAPDRFQIKLVCATVGENAIAPGVEHYLFKVNVRRSNSTGTGSCAGCNDAACLVLGRVVLNQPAGVGDYTLTEAVDRNWVTYNANPNPGECPGAPPPPPPPPPPPIPAAPVLATPVDGATGVANDPTLAWNASAGAASYRLQVSTGVGFWTLLVDEPNLTTTSSALSALAANTVFYWRVNASNAGGTSNYSPIWSFTTVPPPLPVAPVLATPVDGATGVSTNPTLAWNASAGATSYRLQISTEAGFGALVVNQANLTIPSSALSFLAGNTVHYWRVNASNAGGTSGYSSTWSFTTGAPPPPPPPPPVLATPENGATGVANDPTLAWNASARATSYRLQVATDPGFATLVVNQANISTTSSALSSLTASTTYYWRVNASNAGGTSGYSVISSFTTWTQAPPPPPPPAPVLATPVNGTTGVATNPTLGWNASAGATSYRLQVSTDSGFGALAVNQPGLTTTSYSFLWLAASTVHYWRVNASNASGTSGYSTTWSFTTAQAPPSTPWQPDGTPVSATPSSELLSGVVPDGTGGAYVLWKSVRSQGYPGTLALQRIGSNGMPAPGWPIGGRPVIQGYSDDERESIAADGFGGAYVCWVSTGWPDTCLVLRIDANGQPHSGWPAEGCVVAFGRLYCCGRTNFTSSYVIPDPSGSCHVVYATSSYYCHDGPCGYSDWTDVARVSATGAILDAISLYGCSPYAPRGRVEGDGAGGVVGFLEYPCPPYREFITWPATGGMTRVSLGPSTSMLTSLGPDGAGGVWLFGHPSPQLGELRVQRVTMNAVPLPGWEAGVGLPVPNAFGSLGILGDASGGLLFVWSVAGLPTTVRAVRLTRDGVIPSDWNPAGVIVTPPPSVAGSFSAAGDGLGGAFLCWIDSRDQASSGQDLYVTRVLAGGVVDPTYPVGGRRICQSSPAFWNPRAASSEPGASIIAWNDYRNGNWDIYAQRLPLDQSTPALASLVRADATAQGVSLAWRLGGDAASVALQRRIEPEAWAELARLTPDGLGEVAYEDRGLSAGTRVGYRLVLADGSTAGEAWVTTPVAALKLAGFIPNPAPSAARLAFTLASDAPGMIEVLDISGRRVFGRKLAGLGSGDHQLEIAPGSGLAPGVYLIRLTQGETSITARGVVTRQTVGAPAR